MTCHKKNPKKTPTHRIVTAMFLLELTDNQSTERQQTQLWESSDILPQYYPCTFRAADKHIFLEISKTYQWIPS